VSVDYQVKTADPDDRVTREYQAPRANLRMFAQSLAHPLANRAHRVHPVHPEHQAPREIQGPRVRMVKMAIPAKMDLKDPRAHQGQPAPMADPALRVTRVKMQPMNREHPVKLDQTATMDPRVHPVRPAHQARMVTTEILDPRARRVLRDQQERMENQGTKDQPVNQEKLVKRVCARNIAPSMVVYFSKMAHVVKRTVFDIYK